MSAPTPPALARARNLCRSAFGAAPDVVAAAPGRVNLIGEHTDYNDGFVLPMAIDRAIACAARLTSTGEIEVASGAGREQARFPARQVARGQPRWTNYIRGVVAGFEARGVHVPGLQLAIESDVPSGGGLSSSAALEVAVATTIRALTSDPLDPAAMIALCRRAEHEFAGVPCGVMDQTVVVQARAGHALLLDCRSFAIDHVPFASGDTCVLVVNTSVRHSLAAGEYAKRRAECDAAAAALGAASLRDASLDAIASAAPVLTRVAGRRARHVVTENARTLAAARALAGGDWAALGQLMYASHASLSGDFEVSCRELDAVVAIADRIGAAGGVFGARMTGGGFGGCAVCLVRSDAVPSISARISADYRAETGRTAVIFPVHAAAGAHLAGPEAATR